jgi:hypothetical protein
VRIRTEFSVAGRAAQFGRGLMEDISKRLVAQMADGIRERLEAAEPGAATAGGPAPQVASKATTARPVNALALLLSVLGARIGSWFRR